MRPEKDVPTCIHRVILIGRQSEEGTVTIEIQQPELEALIRLRLESGRFTSVEDVLLDALKSSSNSETRPTSERNLVEVCAMVSGLSEGLDFSRDPSPGCDVDLS